MSGRWHATARLIVEFLDRVEERSIVRIVWAMQTEHGITPAATRTALYRLAKAGRIRRLEIGRYGRRRTETEQRPAHDRDLAGD